MTMDDVKISSTKQGFVVQVGKATLPGLYLSPLSATRAAMKYLGKYAELKRQEEGRGRGRPKKGE